MGNLYFKGDTIFLYTQFLDENNKIAVVNNPKVRILHDKQGKIYEDLAWKNMQQLSVNEYFYNYTIPRNSDLGQYQVIYIGEVNGQKLTAMETFHVIEKSDIHNNAMKIYGVVRDLRNEIPLGDCIIQIFDNVTDKYVTQSLTNFDGQWETYLYPGEYKFVFSKVNFIDIELNVQIGDEMQEIQFDTVELDCVENIRRGNGAIKVYDEYILKDGTPLANLSVTIANVNDPTTIIAQDITNDKGEWQCFVDGGVYLLKVNGSSFGIDFNKVFRLKVNDYTGEFEFENLSKNIATANKNVTISSGNGCIIVKDTVIDKSGNAIVDVQINVFRVGQIDDSKIVAQDYTNIKGEWKVQLNPGTYVFEFYHPSFNTVTETRTV